VADAFSNGQVDGCGDAQPNFGFISALITQPPAIISHGNYMYVGPLGGNVIQFAVTAFPNGQSNYQFRTFVTGLSILTGLGVAEDLKSLMIYTDPTTLGLASQEVVTKLPLCEDMLGETTVAGGGTTTTGGGTTTTGGGTTTGTGTTTTGGFTTPTTAAADNSAPITGAIVGGGTASPTSTPATGGAIGGLVTPTTAGNGVGTPSSGAKGGSANGAGTAAAAANPAGVPVTGTVGLFATAGFDPTGPMTAKVTAFNMFGLPRIARDPPPFASPTFVASRPNVLTVLDASARAVPGESVTAKVKTKPRTSDRRNRMQDHLSMTIGNAR
jgi:hypothetical protein